MHPDPKKVMPVVLAVFVVAILAYGGWYYFAGPAAAQGDLTASGTIEAVEVRLGTLGGGRVEAVNVEEGQKVKKGQVVAQVQPATNITSIEEIHSPLNGIVLLRVFEPGELVTAGSTLVTVADLYTLNLTVYVPEDRYGQIALDRAYPVTVDSFPGEAFKGVVTHIADQAEFTPRNVQTVEGRKTTVFAIRLSISNPNLALKPGMPADVNFGK